MSAETTYISAMFAVVAIILWAGAVDFTLYCQSEQTLSAWLRQHLLWIVVPMAIDLLFVAALLLHIFVGH